MIRVPLRVALVYDDSLDRPGGVAEYTTTLAGELVRRGHHVAFLVGGTKAREVGSARVYCLARNVGVRFNGNSLTVPLRSREDEIERVLREERFDVLHVQMPYSPLMAARVIARAAPETAVVGTFHLAADRLGTRAGARLLAAVSRTSAARFDRVMAVSDTAARAAERCFGIDVDTVVPNMTSVAPHVWQAPPRPKQDARASIVFLGRLVPRKGVACLLDAVAQLRASGIEPNVVIAGDGPLRARLERRRDALRLRDLVEFRGAIEPHERAPLFASADIACFPASYGESFGIVLVEAMTAGAGAVVASRIPGYAEVLANDGDVLAPAGDATALAERLATLLRDERLRTSVRRRQRRIAERYAAEPVAARVLAVYSDALTLRRGTPLLSEEAA